MNISPCRAYLRQKNGGGGEIIQSCALALELELRFNPALSRPASRTAFESSFAHAQEIVPLKFKGNALEKWRRG
jgi:hypothetical protein